MQSKHILIPALASFVALGGCNLIRANQNSSSKAIQLVGVKDNAFEVTLFFKDPGDPQWIIIRPCDVTKLGANPEIDTPEQCVLPAQRVEARVEKDALKRHLHYAYRVTDRVPHEEEIKSAIDKQKNLNLELDALKNDLSARKSLLERFDPAGGSEACSLLEKEVKTLEDQIKKNETRGGFAAAVKCQNDLDHLFEKILSDAFHPVVVKTNQDESLVRFSQILKTYLDLYDPAKEYPFAQIPAGSFPMGTFPSPQMKMSARDYAFQYVTVKQTQISQPFEMGIREVSQLEWFKVMGYYPGEFNETNHCDDRMGMGDRNFDHICPDLPATGVSYDQVLFFLDRLSAASPTHTYRLPTEAEWEWAASESDSDDNEYFNENLLKRRLADAHCDASSRQPRPVDDGGENSNKLKNMYGNVAEFTREAWTQPDDKPAQQTAGGTTPQIGSVEITPASYNPHRTYVVIKGGDFAHSQEFCWPSARWHYIQYSENMNVGFRYIRAEKSGSAQQIQR